METSDIAKLLGVALLGFALIVCGMPVGYFIMFVGFAALGYYLGYNSI